MATEYWTPELLRVASNAIKHNGDPKTPEWRASYLLGQMLMKATGNHKPGDYVEVEVRAG